MVEVLVLGNTAVHETLLGLNKADTEAFRDAIASSLADYSARGERQYQPAAAVVGRPDGRTTLFRLFTSDGGPGVKIIVNPASHNASQAALKTTSAGDGTKNKSTLHGILVASDEDGVAKGLVNADAITAYRTAMSAMIPYSWRARTADIVIFGAGNTAWWHIRLATKLRGPEIKTITVINRSVHRATDLVSQCQQETEAVPSIQITFNVLDPAADSYDEKLQEVLARADVVFSTTPSSRPLFPSSYVTKPGPGKFISGIGSWQPAMVELDPELFQAASRRGQVIVDDQDETMKSAGEVIHSQLKAEQMVELGSLVHMQSAEPETFERENKRYLSGGLVVYKSVGVSITDLAAANVILSLAKEQGRGTLVPDF